MFRKKDSNLIKDMQNEVDKKRTRLKLVEAQDQSKRTDRRIDDLRRIARLGLFRKP